MAQLETYVDATPNIYATADNTAIAVDQSVLNTNAVLEAANGTSSTAQLAQDIHLRDQEQVDYDDLAVQARQRAIDLATGTYGESGPSSDLTGSTAALAGEQAKETADKLLP